MNASEEWLRYIENRQILEEYNIKGYDYEKVKNSNKDTYNTDNSLNAGEVA